MGSDEMTDSDSRHHGVLHHQHQRKEETKGIPKGCVTVLVGNGDLEELERFVVPVMYVNHPLFSELLKEAEEEYGFDRKGPITIPCRVEEFRNVKGSIERERHSYDRHHQNHQDDHDRHHHFLCFKA